MRVILITPPDSVEDEHILITRMFKEGLPLLHLRKQGYDHGAMSGYLTKIPLEFHKRIVIHSCYELAQGFNIRGLHITGSNIAYKNEIICRYKNKEGFTVSISYHALEELGNNDPGIDYIFLSPVFDSISKKNYKAQFNHAELTEALKRSRIDVVALGGLRLANIHEVKALGFKGMAFLGAVWGADDPLKSYLDIQKQTSNME
ncbi:MAG: thiamine phosphate synthase [Deltaproteobacteria bacterium]|nr:thiamine phosphate synthase [Deltaproteobacteria bacterium]